MKKLLIFLVIILTLCIPVIAQENLAEGTIDEAINWAIKSDGTLRVSGTGDIPNFTKSALAPWYQSRELITAIAVEEGITGIGDYTFYGLSNAVTIDISDSVYHLGQFFIRETGIAEITLNTAKEVEPFAFSSTPNLKTITFGEAVKNFKGNIFGSGEYSYTIKAPTDSYVDHYVRHYSEKYTTSLVQLTFESTGNAVAPVQHFSFAGDNVFYVIYANSATNWAIEVTGGSRMKNFPYISTKYMGQLTPMYDIAEFTDNERIIKSIKIYDGVETIGNYSFYKCNKATKLEFPDNITSIGAGAFWACAKLTEINIPDTVTKIGRNAFNGCANLVSVTIPDSVTELGQNIFVKCNPEILTVTTDNKMVIDVLREQHSDVTIKTTVVEEKPLSISEVFKAEPDSVVKVEGYFVGVSYEGVNGNQEMLVKDIVSDSIISVCGVPYGSFPDYNYDYGDRVCFEATVKLSDSEHNSGKRYLDFSENNGDIGTTVISKGNEITYTFENAVTLDDWNDMKSFFNVETIPEYTYIKIDGDFYLNHYGAGDVYRPHMNSKAGGAVDIKPDGVRTISMRNDIFKANLGKGWTKKFYDEVVLGFPGAKLKKTFYALYTGANSNYFQLIILDKNWISEYQYSNEDVITEMAYAYQRQGGQVQYDQATSTARRHITATPEDATSQKQIYLDCSSFVNSCYLEAFGVHVLPVPPSSLRPSTGNFDNYARDNQSNPDVIGYWKTSDYTTVEEQEALLKSVQDMLQVGDLINYRHGKTSGTSGHVMMYIGNDTFIHCYAGGSYVVNSSDPSKSYDAHATESSGMIGTMASSALFTNKTSARYLFKKTEADTVTSFALIRPLAKNLVSTEKAQARMRIAGLVMDKVSSVGVNSAVYTGDTITYTITLKNVNSTDVDGVKVTDVVPVGTEYVSGDLTLNGTSLSWSGTVAASKTVTLKYTVRVIATEKGSLINSNSTYVSGLKLGSISHTVSGFDFTSSEYLTNYAQNLILSGVAFSNPITLVNTLYRGALGIDPFTSANVNSILDMLIDTENLTYRTDTPVSKMLVPTLYGGTDIKDGNYKIPDSDRTRLISESELSVGDVILAEWSGGSVVYVYTGNSTLLTLKDGVCSTLTIGGNIYGTDADNILISLFGYDRFAVLRPSMIHNAMLSVNSISVITPPIKIAYNSGETFDSDGMVVSATLSDGTVEQIYNYTVTPETLMPDITEVTISFGALSTTIPVTVSNTMNEISVSDAFALDDGTLVTIEGYYVGSAVGGTGTDVEYLIKDIENDNLISLQGISSVPYVKGDRVRLCVNVKKESNSHNIDKTYLQYSELNPDINDTIISSGNEIAYSLENVVTVSTWAEMKSLFNVNTLKPYTYIRFTGTSYFNYYSSADTYRLHKNSSATAVAQIKPDTVRTLSFRNDVMTANLGSSWKSLFFSKLVTGQPGTKITKDFYCVYTGANTYYYQFAVLEADWITAQ